MQIFQASGSVFVGKQHGMTMAELPLYTIQNSAHHSCCCVVTVVWCCHWLVSQRAVRLEQLLSEWLLKGVRNCI